MPKGFSQNTSDDNALCSFSKMRLTKLRWKGAIVVFLLTSLISGYDVSNVANIQPIMYETFGNIKLLPWIGLSYSLANFAFLSFARKVTCLFDLRLVHLVHIVIFIAGAAVSSMASDISSVIVGRVIMGWGGSVVQHTNLAYITTHTTSAHGPKIVALISAMWATGLAVGGPLGSAFAENKSLTWRWAFYINIPLGGVALLLAICCLPSCHLELTPRNMRLPRIDILGIVFNVISPVLFAVATTFSGSIWSWGSTESIAVWAIFGLTLFAWTLQQHLCILTTPDDRACPLHMFKHLGLLPLWTICGCAGATYAVALYYYPLFFAFVRGHGAIEQTVRLLPFILAFIITVLLTGAILPRIENYRLVFGIAGILTVAGAAVTSATLEKNGSETHIMVAEGILGVGLGMQFQHAIGICNAICTDVRDRIDSTFICNMTQMGSIAGTLAIAGCIFQNVGYRLLSDIPGSESFSEDQLREALAGVLGEMKEAGNALVIRQVVYAVAQVISYEFYIVATCGVLVLAAVGALFMPV